MAPDAPKPLWYTTSFPNFLLISFTISIDTWPQAPNRTTTQSAFLMMLRNSFLFPPFRLFPLWTKTLQPYLAPTYLYVASWDPPNTAIVLFIVNNSFLRVILKQIYHTLHRSEIFFLFLLKNQ